jgi:predicted XRE-type DNA-binding protein
MNRFYVYWMRAADELRPFYIGKGTGRRWKGHFRPSRRDIECPKNDHIDGVQGRREEVVVKKILSGLAEEKAWELEKFLISEIGKSNLTNRTGGGQGGALCEKTKQKISEKLLGHDVSEETRRKMAESHSGEDHYFYNREFTEEHCQNISDANSLEGHPQTNLTKQDVAEIRWLAQNTELYQREIGSLYDIEQAIVSYIVLEKEWKGIEPKRPEEPVDVESIVEQRTPSTTTSSSLDEQDVEEIQWLLDNTQMNQGEIANAYDVAPSSISNINTGTTYSQVTTQRKPADL